MYSNPADVSPVRNLLRINIRDDIQDNALEIRGIIFKKMCLLKKPAERLYMFIMLS